MLEDVFKEDSAAPEPPPAPKRKLRIPPFVLFPLLLLVLAGGIVYFFGLLSFDSTGPMDLVGEIRSARGERRALAAYELSRRPSYGSDPAERKALAAAVLESFESEAGGDLRIRRSLALALGRLGDPVAVPALIQALEDPDAETVLYGVWALGAIGDPRAVEAVASRLRHEDPGVRKMATFALGQIGDPRAIPSLQVALQDATPDVGWNAAVALARLGDATALPVLLPLLEKEPATAGLTSSQIEELRLNALRALKGLRDDRIRSVVARVATSDASPRVRNEARGLLRGESSPPSPPPPPAR
jgi:HEAT repeat protein